MTVKILLSIIALALSVCASAKIDYADYKKLQEAYQIPAPEAEKLSESGNPYAKLRSALDNIPYEREKSVSEIRELYEKRGLRLAGYYLSNFLKDKAEREKLLEKLAAEGDDYACSAAKCDLLFDNLKASSDAADAKKIQRLLRQPIEPRERRLSAGGSKARVFYRDKLRQNKKF